MGWNGFTWQPVIIKLKWIVTYFGVCLICNSNFSGWNHKQSINFPFQTTEKKLFQKENLELPKKTCDKNIVDVNLYNTLRVHQVWIVLWKSIWMITVSNINVLK